MLSQLQREANTWFELALSRAPIELHSTLQVRDTMATICGFLLRAIPRNTWPRFRTRHLLNLPSWGHPSLSTGQKLSAQSKESLVSG